MTTDDRNRLLADCNSDLWSVRRRAFAALGPLAKDDAEVRAAIQAIVGPLPVVTGLASQVLKRVETDPAALDMATWHHCETTHCLAGWATHLAGARGAELESQFNAAIAGALIWGVSEGYVPDFYADNATALADLRSRVRSCPAT